MVLPFDLQQQQRHPPTDAETDDIGIYSAENVVIDNCQFADIGGTALHLHRGGNDESTFGPMLQLNNPRFQNVGGDKRNKAAASAFVARRAGGQDYRL
ncbi:MAG: hypothetical protein IPJ00_21680 [Saprospirales bacterium]|nr:hypothetical protein [Saprospirales bacterium]